MRTRVLAVLVALFATLLVALGVPLALSYAGSQARTVYIDRLADVARFAELLPLTPTDVDEAAMLDELRRYEDLYGIPVTVLGAEGSVSVASRPGALGEVPRAMPAVRAALAGRTSAPPDRIIPWERGSLVVAQPLVRNGDVVGAVVSVSDLGAARGRVQRVWLVLAGLGATALAAGVVVAQAIARWVLRPVAVLDRAAHRITDGDLSVRIPAAGGPAELRRLADSFNAMAGSVQGSLEAQRAFVADASHQLRNPLSALLVRLQALTLSAAPQHQAAVERALDDGRHLAETLDRLLELARAEHVDSEATRVDVEALLEERLASWRVVADSREMSVRRTGDPVPSAWHDRAAVIGSVDAVLDNALKYGPAGSTVTVQTSSRGDVVEIVVADEGPGLDGEELQRATDRFWRGRRHPDVPGSGLGLSIAAILLARHGGSLHVEPRPGAGLQVRLRLPVPPPDDTDGGQRLSQGLPRR